MGGATRVSGMPRSIAKGSIGQGRHVGDDAHDAHRHEPGIGGGHDRAEKHAAPAHGPDQVQRRW